MRTSRVLAIILLALGAMCAPASGEDWRGWRGLERQAVGTTQPAPQKWSAIEGVLWKTRIPGRGHSSPVIWQNNVYVTTVYETDRWAALHRKVAWGEAALALPLCAAAVAFSLRRSRTWRSAGHPLRHLVVAGVVFVSALLLAGLVLFGDHALDLSRSTIRAWIASSLAGSACLIAAAFLLPAGTRLRRGLGLLTVAFGVFVALGVPEKQRAYRFGLAGKNMWVLMAVAALPIMAGTRLLQSRRQRPAVEARGKGTPADRPPAQSGPLGAVVFLLCMAASAAGAWLAMRYAAHVSTYVAYHVNNVRIEPLVGWRAAIGFAVACALSSALLSMRGGNRWLRPGVVAAVAVLLAGVYFANANYLNSSPEAVRAVVCVHRHSGDIRWIREGLPGEIERLHPGNSPATPTPVVDERGVYAYFGAAGLMAIDHGGELRWTRTDLPYKGPYGVASSPILHEGTILILADQPAAPYVVAIDSRTGRDRWRVSRPGVRDDYRGGSARPPMVRTLSGEATVIVWGWDDLSAYDFATGRNLWTYPIKCHGEVAPTMVWDDQRLYLVDREHARAVNWRGLEQTARDKTLVEDDLPLEWAQKIVGPDCASPVLYGGLIFSVTYPGTAICLDASTGERLWKQKLDGSYYSSPVVAGQCVYFTSNEGVVTVAAADRNFQKVAENDLEAMSFATPAPVDGRLYFRTISDLWCVGR